MLVFNSRTSFAIFFGTPLHFMKQFSSYLFSTFTPMRFECSRSRPVQLVAAVHTNNLLHIEIKIAEYLLMSFLWRKLIEPILFELYLSQEYLNAWFAAVWFG